MTYSEEEATTDETTTETTDYKYDLSIWRCDCDWDGPRSEDHRHGCLLQECWEFTHGWYVWDAEYQELIDVVEAIETGLLVGRSDFNKNESTSAAAYVDDNDDDVRYKNWWDDPDSYVGTGGYTSSTTSYGGGWNDWGRKCSHFQAPFRLPSGVEVYASTYHGDRMNDPLPDLGIYLDGIWSPDTVAFHVGCPDYGTPIPPLASVIYVAREGLRAAGEGKRVEIGCVGGHGRTGLMLAIMALLSMRQPNARQAINLVRSAYCTEAIESAEQEWYISVVEAELKNLPHPPKPPKPEYPKYFKNEEDGEWYRQATKDSKPVKTNWGLSKPTTGTNSTAPKKEEPVTKPTLTVLTGGDDGETATD